MLIALAVCVALGAVFLASAGTTMQVAQGQDRRLKARMIAESGLAAALAYVEQDGAWRTERPNGQWVASQAFGGGTFTVRGEDGDQLTPEGVVVGDGSLSDDLRDPVTITSVGTFQGTRYLVRGVCRPAAVGGIAVRERVTLVNKSLIDSYDPDLGPYTKGKATAAAVVESNGLARKPYLLLSDSARVNGNLYYGPGGKLAKAVVIKNSAVVTGSIAALPAAVAIPELTEPTLSVANAGDVAQSSGVITLTGDAWYENLNLSGTVTLRAVGDVRLLVEDHLSLTDTAKIELGNPVAYAAATKGAISVNGKGTIDGYNSSSGAYGGGNKEQPASVATNSILPAAITVGLGSIDGDAFTGVGSIPLTSIVAGGGAIKGERKALTAALNIPAPPAAPNLGAVAADITGGQTISSNTHVAKVSISGGALVRVSGHRVLRVTDEFRVDNSTLEILPNSSLTVYVGGKITFKGGHTAVNAALRDPSKLVIYGTGAGQAHEILDQSQVHAVIDAPNSSLSITNQAALYGAFMGQSLSLGNFGELHLDRNPAVAAANPRLPVTYTQDNSLAVYVKNQLTLAKSAQLNANTADPTQVQVYHLGTEPMAVKESAVGYADLYVPNINCDLTGAAKWYGRLRVRDLNMSGTASITTDASGGAASPGVLAEETIVLEDSATVSGTGGAAVLASHGATDTTIQLKDSSAFKGDGYTAPGGNPLDEIRVANTATFTGKKAALTDNVDISVQSGPSVDFFAPFRTYSGSSVTTITGDVYASVFQMRDNAVLRVSGNTRLIIWLGFLMRDSARIELLPGARLTIYCPGPVFIERNAQVNVGGRPADLVMNCRGAFLLGWMLLKHDAKFVGTVFGPPIELLMTDRAEFSGSFRGKRVWLLRDAKFHCAVSKPPAVDWIEQR